MENISSTIIFLYCSFCFIRQHFSIVARINNMHSNFCSIKNKSMYHSISVWIFPSEKVTHATNQQPSSDLWSILSRFYLSRRNYARGRNTIPQFPFFDLAHHFSLGALCSRRDSWASWYDSKWRKIKRKKKRERKRRKDTKKGRVCSRERE